MPWLNSITVVVGILQVARCLNNCGRAIILHFEVHVYIRRGGNHVKVTEISIYSNYIDVNINTFWALLYK